MEKDNIYRARSIAFKVLSRILSGGAYSNLALKSALKKPNLSPEDRRGTTLLVYGVLRNLSLLDAVFKARSARGKISASPSCVLFARMALYEMLFEDKVPSHSSVFEYVRMTKKECGLQESKFMNACLRRASWKDVEALLAGAESESQKLALEFSHPEWYVQSMIDTFGEQECRKILEADNSGMPSYYRVNTTKVTQQQIVELYSSLQIEADPVAALPGCISFSSGQNFYPAREFQAGWLTPQDCSTQAIAHEVAPKPGEAVLDLCCGRGTKATHLAELMGNKGKVVACDLYEHKIELLVAEKKRLGLGIIEPVVADVTRQPPLGRFDRVLLDAPCTGTGTFRRRPELKQRIGKDDVAKMMKIQSDLLCAAAGYVKPGGRLVYSTCSLLPEENDIVVEMFLKKQPEFGVDWPAAAAETVPCFRSPFGKLFLPHTLNSCGAAAFILKRN